MLNLGEVQDKLLQVQKEGELLVYFLDGQKIGVWDPKVNMDRILYLQEFKENDSIKDEIDNIVEQLTQEEIEKIQEELQYEEIEELEEVLSLDDSEKIVRVAKADLKQKIQIDGEKGEKNNEKQDVEEDQKESILTGDITVKQEAKLNKKLTVTKTLGQVLAKEGLLPHDGKEYVSIGAVESSSLNSLTNENGGKEKNLSTRYAMVAIATDGTKTKLDIPLDYQEGNNPTEVNPVVKRNGEVEYDHALSQFRVGEGAISIKNGQYGELELFYTDQKTRGINGIEGNQTGVQTQITTSQVYDMSRQEMELNAEYAGEYHSDEKMKEASEHDEDCEELTIEDVDGDTMTKSHLHTTSTGIIDSNGNVITYQEIANQWGFYARLENGQPDIDYIQEKLEKQLADYPDKTVEELVEEEAEDSLENSGPSLTK